LRAGDADAADGYLLARSIEASGGELGSESSEIGEAGGEAEEVDVIFRRGVEFDDALGREVVDGGEVFEVGSELAAVADGDFDDPACDGDGFSGALAEGAFDGGSGGGQGIVDEQDRTICGVNV
jgi:hypothetical protein